ncbi:MAG: CMP/dCMP kinase [Thermomicrobiales bacterium]|nr:CMP/dCMP kinase [Thermomicrobiales bacterium]
MGGQRRRTRNRSLALCAVGRLPRITPPGIEIGRVSRADRRVPTGASKTVDRRASVRDVTPPVRSMIDHRRIEAGASVTMNDVRGPVIDRSSSVLAAKRTGHGDHATRRTNRTTRDRRDRGTRDGTTKILVETQDAQRHPEDAMSSPLDHREDEEPTTGEDHSRVIAIDGPAAAGKTTVARALADRLAATYLDTGLLYRAVTLAALRAGLAPTDGDAIARLALASRFEILPQGTPDQTEHILLDGEVVTPSLRTPEIDRHVSAISAHPAVRAALLPIQRRIADGGSVVMVGRDITTVVVPDAGVKIFLNASPAERARRRLNEQAALGRVGSFEDMLREIERRDQADSTRAIAPLRAADDVTIVETDGRDVDAIVDDIADLALRTWQEHATPARAAGGR